MAPEDEALHHFSPPASHMKSDFIDRNTPAETQSGRYDEESDHTPQCI